MKNWYQMAVPDLLQSLGTDPVRGLTEPEADRRLKEHGYNELAEKRKKWHQLLWDEIRDFMVIILSAAALIALLTGDTLDAVVIGFTVALNVLMGFFQQYKTEQAVAALKARTTLKTRVTREGRMFEIPARKLVPGDIVHLEAGDQIPADGRLVEVAGLLTDESTLTGESVPVEKDVLPLEDNPAWAGKPALGEMRNLVFTGAVVTGGRGKAVIVATGMNTELGRIARLIQDEAPQTPLQVRLTRLGKVLAWAALFICLAVFVLGILRGESERMMLLTAITLAVAVVPESLPTVVTVVLALGAQAMYRQKALMRKLAAVETLGCVSVICSDKTGTLTQNKMRVEEVFIATGEPALLYLDMVLCNDAHFFTLRERQGFGDPTDFALLRYAEEEGLNIEKTHLNYPRLAQAAFDPKRKRMSVLCRVGDRNILFVKGAADGILELSTGTEPDVASAGLGEAGTSSGPGAIGAPIGSRAAATGDGPTNRVCLREAERLSAEGYRVLAFACKTWDGNPAELTEADEEGLTFLGLAALMDPLREEVSGAVEKCRQAGIKTVMITGDHPLTAFSIAKKLGIAGDKSQVLTGVQLERKSDEELREIVEQVRVYARVSPEHKMRIVEALQQKGHIAAMTGDGVNDGPALKKADIGVAMGQIGTDVSRQAADMVLLDDNFNTIVRAVELGRTIYDNIRKFICYMLTANFSEVVVMLLALVCNMPVPFIPIQVLWINIVAEGLPALALSREPTERDVMTQPTRDPRETVFARGVGIHILWVGMFIGLITLGVLVAFRDNPEWRTMVFLTMVLCQLAHVLAIRSTRHSVLFLPWLGNPYLLVTVLAFFLIQMALIYWPPLQAIFGTTALTLPQALLCAGVSGLVFVAVEVEKFFYRRRNTYFRGEDAGEWGIF